MPALKFKIGAGAVIHRPTGRIVILGEHAGLRCRSFAECPVGDDLAGRPAADMIALRRGEQNRAGKPYFGREIRIGRPRRRQLRRVLRALPAQTFQRGGVGGRLHLLLGQPHEAHVDHQRGQSHQAN